MAVTADPVQTKKLEDQFGHPGDKWDLLKAKIQDQVLTEFADVQSDWLDLLWTLDAYRISSVVPRDMGKVTNKPGSRLSASTEEGNWYAEVLALLLGNRTSQKLAPRSRVEGFSQWHQIDVAWPDREVNPLICLETKVTGAPAYDDTPARGALSDWSNRRKELKFAATDLKLWRRSWKTSIDHWDEWRTRRNHRVTSFGAPG